VDDKILQKLNEIGREFKTMERFRVSMVKNRKARIMKRIKKGEPADYKGYKKELTARIKTHLTRVNKSIKAYSKILKKKSRKPRKKSVKKSRKPRKKKSVKKSRKPRKKKSVKKSRKPRKKKSVKKSRKPRKKYVKKSKRKKMRMCGSGVNNFHMKKSDKKSQKRTNKEGMSQYNERMDKFLLQIEEALRILCPAIPNKKIYHNHNHRLLSHVIAGQNYAKNIIFSRISNNKTPFELIEAAPGRVTRKLAIEYFYDSWLCSYANRVKEQAMIHKEKKDDEFLGSHEFGKLSVDKNTSDLTGALGNLKL
tara:strand:+ start:845 stop:1768 length:924 start_codon:yes stop_codon:yes gene_type:complete